MAYRLADFVGNLAWLVNGPARRAVQDNLLHVVGRQPSAQLVRRVFRSGARNYFETFLIPRLTAAELLALVPTVGWWHLDQALAQGRGAIMVGVHLSGVALAAQVIAARGYRVTAVTERVEPPELNALLEHLRGAPGLTVRSLGPRVTNDLLAALRRKEVVGLIMDRDVAGTGVPVRFFGAETTMPSGAALLALRTGAPIIPALAIRQPDGRFAGEVGPPISIERGADVRASVQLTTQRIALRFEHHIRACPGEWTVFQPRWRRCAEAVERRLGP